MILRPNQHKIKLGNHDILVFYPGDTPFEVKSVNKDNYSGINKFDYLYIDFGNKFSHLRNSTVEHKKDFTVTTLENDKLNEEFEFIRDVSNSKIKFNLQNSKKFLDSYKNIFDNINKEKNFIDSDAFVVPLMGGGIIAKLLDIPEKRTLALNTKRIPSNIEGQFSLGMNAEKNNFGLTNSKETADEFWQQIEGKKVCILEVCVASGITTLGFFIDLYLRKAKPRSVQLVSAVMSQQSIDLLNNDLKELNFDFDIGFSTGKVVYKLLDFYKDIVDSVAYDNGEYAVMSPSDAYAHLNVSEKQI